MIDGVLRTLVIAVGLLVIWWLCGPAGQRDRPVSREGDESRESDARVDAQRR
jgi:hypothetical protein